MLKQLQSYIPDLTYDHIEPSSKSGIRALALKDDGNLIEDFLFNGIIKKYFNYSKCNSSPAATSSLAIAEMISDEVSKYCSI